MDASRDRSSALLARLVASPEGAPLTLGGLAASLGDRGFGLVMLAFALPNAFPMPPGVSTVTGIPLFILALEMALGLPNLWLPRFLRRRPLPHAGLAKALLKAQPFLQRFERLSRPRLLVLTALPGQVVLGLVALVLATILVLPIPLVGNWPPGVALTVLALALIERDGLLLLLGYGLAAIAIALSGSLVAGVVVAAAAYLA
ncbi:MAG: exopolysaccharide biosynthesis protein [Pseudomonadota bacterium]|jgi:hypothetical protein